MGTRWLAILPAIALAISSHAVAEEDHSAHRAMTKQQKRYSVSTHKYVPPDVTLLDQDGNKHSLRSLMGPSKPVVADFIFTTCTTICPVMTATMSRMRKELGEEFNEIQLVSFSIDPEFDTPPLLKEYAEKWRMGDNWRFVTGTVEQIIEVQKAFDGYVANKMNHRPFYMLKARGSDEWVRIDGLVRGADMAHEYRMLTEK